MANYQQKIKFKKMETFHSEKIQQRIKNLSTKKAKPFILHSPIIKNSSSSSFSRLLYSFTSKNMF